MVKFIPEVFPFCCLLNEYLFIYILGRTRYRWWWIFNGLWWM